jgi:gamma-glutamyl-gamma-aminobutyrate hydrolase PuuD
VLNVASGGTLVNDQPDPAGHDRDRPGPADLPGRDIRISPDSRLGGILGAGVTVPACQHQAVAQLGSGVIATGWAAGDVVAAAELTAHRFGIGVHWHPELDDDMRIFEALRAAADASPQRIRAAATL